jgi:hypothetical protein
MVKERRADGTTLAGTFDLKQTVVDPAGPLHQLGQVLEPGQDPDVSGFVDDGLDTQGPPFFQILLDPAVLVAKIHPDLGPCTEDPGGEGLGRGPAATVAPKDGMDLVGSADADVVLDQGLEEPSGPARIVVQRSKKPWTSAGPK